MAAMKTAHNLLEKKRTSDVLSSENINVDFASLMLSDPVQKGLTSSGFEKPSPIQLKAIPLGRCGLDLIIQAKSGTGKTCVFSVIALENVIAASNSLQILILAPTREIAVQIHNVIQAIGGAIEGLKCYTFIGGTIFGQDRQNLKKCHIAVGTPGRIKQLIEYDVLKTDSVRLFILDEADKLLDEKFQASVNWIYHHLPENKQMLALSATYPESLAQQLTNYMRDPTFVRLNPRDLVLQGIKQFYMIVPGHLLPHKAFQIKADHLVDLLSQIAFNQCLIFSNLQSRAQNLCDLLLERGWPVSYISGNQEQVDRMKAMAELKTYKCRILISTDLTARGIDAENVNLIINLDVPTDFKTYLHRIGRAGRFGTHGAAITLASEGSEVGLLKTVQKRSGSDIKVLPDPLPSNLLELTFQEVETEVLDIESRNVKNDSGNLVEQHSSSSITASKIHERCRVETGEGERLVTHGDGKIKENQKEESKREEVSPGEDRHKYNVQDEEHLQIGSQLVSSFKKEDIKPAILKETVGRARRENPIWSMRNDLQDWLVPMAILQQVKETSRKRWTWEEVVNIFEDRETAKDEVIEIKSKVRKSLEKKSVQEIEKDEKSDTASDWKSQKVSEERVVRDGCLSYNEEEIINSVGQGELDLKGEERDDDMNGRLKHSDILVEFQALRDLRKRFMAGDVDLVGSVEDFIKGDEVDGNLLLIKKKNLAYDGADLKTSKGNGDKNEEEKVENVSTGSICLAELQLGKNNKELGGCSHPNGGKDEKLHEILDLGSTDERDLSTEGDVTGRFALWGKEKSIDDSRTIMINEQRHISTNHSFQEVNDHDIHSRRKTHACHEGTKYETLLDFRDVPSLREMYVRNAEGTDTNPGQNKPASIVCRIRSNNQSSNTSDKIWEYFKLFATTGSPNISWVEMVVIPSEREENIGKEMRKDGGSVVKLEADSHGNDEDDAPAKYKKMETLHLDNLSLSEISDSSSKSAQESDNCSGTDQYEESDQYAHTDQYSVDSDQYTDSDMFYFGGKWSEKSADFGGTYVDVPLSRESNTYSTYRDDWYPYYLREMDHRAAKDWDHYYATLSILWDSQSAYYDDQFSSPYYYKDFYPTTHLR